MPFFKPRPKAHSEDIPWSQNATAVELTRTFWFGATPQRALAETSQMVIPAFPAEYCVRFNGSDTPKPELSSGSRK